MNETTDDLKDEERALAAVRRLISTLGWVETDTWITPLSGKLIVSADAQRGTRHIVQFVISGAWWTLYVDGHELSHGEATQ